MSGQDHSHALGVGAAVLAGVAWSVGGLLFRLVEGPDVWPLLAWRFVAFAVFFAALLSYRGRLFAFVDELGWRAALGGILITFASVFFVFSLDYTTVFNALMMLSIQPLLSACLGWLFLREPVRTTTWIAILLAMGGISVMVWEGISAGGFTGNLLAFCSSVSFAGYTVFTRSVGTSDTTACVMLGGVFGALIALAMSLLGGSGLLLSTHDIGLAFIMGWFQIGVGFLLFNWGVRYIRAAEISVLIQLEILLGPVWVWLVSNEVPTTMALIGGGVLLCAVFLQAVPRRQEAAQA